ncbi:MAG: efflux RND transporter periplasmic adaptor subunit, partial [Planctomycetota bacterium]
TPLAPSGAVARARLEQAQADLQQAEARRDAARARLDLLRAGTRPEVVAEAQAAAALAATRLARAEQERAWCELRAPANGVVYERFVQVGAIVDPARSDAGHTAGAVLTLYDPAQLQVRVDLTQDDAAQVQTGDGAVVTLAAAPGRSFAGRVVRIDPRGDLAKNTVRVRVRLEAAGPGLHPDLTARVAFERASDGGAAVIRIPARCVVTAGSRTTVWAVRAGAAQPVEVSLGDAAGREVVVKTGLKGGETLILDPPSDLIPGAAVSSGGGSQ